MGLFEPALWFSQEVMKKRQLKKLWRNWLEKSKKPRNAPLVARLSLRGVFRRIELVEYRDPKVFAQVLSGFLRFQ